LSKGVTQESSGDTREQLAGKRLSTTAYCLLGLMSLRDWTTYELAEQMRRGVGDLWSAARSMVYAEPKFLAAAGLATVRHETVGRRPRTVYSITPEGREALDAWLALPGEPPAMQFEGVLKVLLSNAAHPEWCRPSVEAARAWARSLQEVGRQVASEYLSGDAPFPERMLPVSLTFSFLWHYSAAVLQWAEWAAMQLDAGEGEEASALMLRPFLDALGLQEPPKSRP
jgi:DNA-binding PadR family transcriptional regulator